ncbi:hypothetical protein Leryth_007677 [Lithospermum erythrorhizon]|nr:hypothetical protein Leryth_007677 [Lithospermum erythrorhizon]
MGENKGARHWLLVPLTESKLQLFVVISFWISSKIHDSPPISVKDLKKLTDKFIKEQHFTSRDFLDAEVVLLQVLEFEIGTSRIAFVFLDELVKEFKAVACIGEYLSFESCMDVMDLLYEEEEETSSFSPRTLAASVLVAAYAITVPIQRWEFPVIPWVKFVASCNEDDVMEMVRKILKHVFG